MPEAGERQRRHSGGCQCGAVRYATYAPLDGAHLCHCRMCQKAVGGPFAAFAGVDLADFAWTRGEPAVFASSTAAIRHFCAACGTPLTFHYLAKTRISVTLGSLDHPEEVPPLGHYGAEARLAWTKGWDTLPEEATETDQLPPGLANHQHPDHDTPSGWRPHRGAGQT